MYIEKPEVEIGIRYDLYLDPGTEGSLFRIRSRNLANGACGNGLVKRSANMDSVSICSKVICFNLRRSEINA